MGDPLLLKVSNVGKRFPGVVALDNVSLSVTRGKVHALLGENGAGKSTLLKILAGAQYHDSGTIEFDGKPLGHELPHERQRLGIVTVYQEFTVIPNLSVAENIFIGREPRQGNFLSWPTMLMEARKVAEKLDLRVEPLTPVYALSVAEQQMVEIARALTMNAKLIILDEPTAALSDREVEKLHQIVRDLKAQGIGIIYVTHRLGEVKQICDRFTVLRDGKYAGEAEVADTSIDQIVRMMVGRNVEYLPGEHHKPGGVVARVEGLTRLKRIPGTIAVPLRGMSLQIRKGEILGLAGLVGAGRTELARALFGADRFDSGTIYFNDKQVIVNSVAEAIDLGMALVPEDRKRQGLFLTHSIRQNMTLPSLKNLLVWPFFINQRAERELVESYRKALRIRMAHQEVIVGTLSGGNQQKVILARCMALKPKLLIVDEPTRGIDIGAKAEVHHLLRQLAAEGTAVVAISSELPEVISLSDRIVTVKEGRITGDMPATEATEEKLMKLMVLGLREHHVPSAPYQAEYSSFQPGFTMAETTTPDKVTEQGKKQPFEWIAFLRKFGVFLFLILLIIFFSTQNPRFLSIRNLLNILTDVSIYGIMGVGMTLVILTAGVDLSVGAILALCAMCGAAAIKGTGATRSEMPDPHKFGGFSWLIALLICVALGTLAGFAQGKVSTKFRIPPFIVTLGGMTVWRGATLLIGAGSPISGFDDGYNWWGAGSLLGVPVPVLVFLVAAVVGYIALRYTPYGRHVYAAGGNPEAARLNGLRIDRILTSVYAIMGFLAGLAGFIQSARLSSAEATAGLGFELTVIASVVIGGTSLMGGIGGIAGTVVGTLLIGVLLNGLVIMNVNPYFQQIIIGGIIVLAVGFDTYAKSHRVR